MKNLSIIYIEKNKNRKERNAKMNNKKDIKKSDPLKDIKEKEEQRAELVNLILDYSIANKMAFKDVKEAVVIVRDLYLSDGLIKH